MTSLTRTGVLATVAALAYEAGAQHWEVDPALCNIAVEGEAYADACSNNQPPPPGNCVTRPTVETTGLCPPDGYGFGAAWAAYPQWVWAHDPPATQLFANASFFGTPVDLGAYYSTMALDLSFFPNQAESALTGWVKIDGVDSRTLRVSCFISANGAGVDDDFFTRVCGQITANLPATAVDLPTGALAQVFIRHDWDGIGETNNSHECLVAPWDALCVQMGLPLEEDPSQTRFDMQASMNGGPFAAFVPNVQLDNMGGMTGPWGNAGFGSSIIPPGTTSVPVITTFDGEAGQTLQFPEAASAASEAGFQGHVVYRIIAHDFLAGEPFDDYMRVVPAGGPGPQHRFRMGRYEITNQQFADFLNATEYDGGQTAIGAHMMFGADGDLMLPDGTVLFQPAGLAPSSRIVYTPAAPIGTRYTVDAPAGADPRVWERHPVVNVGWIAALKFCNWVTLMRGLPAGERCYTEGDTADEWHPATITAGDWAVRDLTSAERQALVDGYSGFRLAMDGLGTATGWIGSQVNAHNEWFKAAAYDPAAPGVPRSGPMGEVIPSMHWTYGFGRDVIGSADANFLASGDPFEADDAFVGMYDGTKYNDGGGGDVGDGNEHQTAASANPWGLYDMSGNVVEWVQDKSGSLRGVRSGSWDVPATFTANSGRDLAPFDDLVDSFGFRIVQTSCPGDVNFDGVVDVQDLMMVITAWGSAGAQADLNGDGTVDVVDLLAVFNSWGACP